MTVFKQSFLLVFFLWFLIAEVRGSAYTETAGKMFFTLLPAVRTTTTGPVEPDTTCTDPNSVKTDLGSISGQVVIKEKFDGGSVTLSENYLNSARISKTRIVSVIQLPSSGSFMFSNLPAGNYVVEPGYYNADNGPITYSPATGYYYFVIVNKYSWTRSVILGKGQTSRLQFSAESAKNTSENRYVYSSNYYTENPYNPYENSSNPPPPVYNYSPYSPYTSQTPNYTPYTAPTTNYTPYTAPATDYTPYKADNPPYSPYTAPTTKYTPYTAPTAPYSPFNYNK